MKILPGFLILYSNQDIGKFKFLVFLTVHEHDYLTCLVDATLTVRSLVRKEFKPVGISRLSLTIFGYNLQFLFLTGHGNTVMTEGRRKQGY
jgi:hypothetical protein